MENNNDEKGKNKLILILSLIIILIIVGVIGAIGGSYFFDQVNNKTKKDGEIGDVNKGFKANTSTYIYEFSDAENIDSIASKFKVTKRELLSSNPKMGEEYNLSVLNHKAVIPNITYYNVMKGDTIESIAKKFDVESETLYDINEIDPESKKIEKKKVMIPNTVVYTVKKGESLKKVAKKYSVSEDSISKLNKLSNNKVVENQILIIPKYYNFYNKDVTINDYSQKIYTELYNITSKMYKDGSYKNYNKNDDGYYLTLGELKKMGHDYTDRITSCELKDTIVVFDINHASDYEFEPIRIKTYCKK